MHCQLRCPRRGKSPHFFEYYGRRLWRRGVLGVVNEGHRHGEGGGWAAVQVF